MLINIQPLKEYRDFRLLYFGQFISFLGSMISHVAIPFQVYELTKDNWLVGMLGIVQLVPLLVFGLLGGTYADRLNRRRLLLFSELLLSFFVLVLAVNAHQERPSIVVIFIVVALFQSVQGFHRPALDALTQKVVEPKDYAAVGALGSFRYSSCAILGPALGGILIGAFGVQAAYALDFLTFLGALISLYLMSRMPDPEKRDHSPWQDAKEGMQFAVSKSQLIGTYIIDIVAMVFAYPVALFPAMSMNWGGASAAGILASSMAAGALITTLFSGWTSKVSHHGRGVIIAATMWAIAIIGLGTAKELWVAVLFLMAAGGADMISGLFRGIIWNQSVPNQLRGRLAGIEMISYMSGPLLGNARAGYVAAKVSVPFSITTGGIVCTICVIATALCLPKFWKYRG